MNGLIVFAASTVIFAPAVARAGFGDALRQLLPESSSPAADFGYATDTDGGIVAVGAFTEEAPFFGAGAAYLFDAVTGQQLHRLVPNDPRPSALFGCDVAINGDLVLVGARQDDDAGIDSGSAYLFDESTGSLLLEITAPDAAQNDAFGWSVDVRESGVATQSVALIGAPEKDGATGAAYLIATINGRLNHTLAPTQLDAGDRFGRAVAIGGSRCAVGATGDDELGENAGVAYLFDVSTGDLLHRLTASDGDILDRFGDSVAIQGSTVLVGAPQAGEGISADVKGAAYVFDADTGQELMKLAPDDETKRFGQSVAIGDDVFAIGASGDMDAGNNAGAVYLFSRESGAFLLKYQTPGLAAADGLGAAQSIEIDGGLAVMGLQGDNSGSAWLVDVALSAADLNGDGAVDAADLAVLIAAWGTSAADLTGDGITGAADLAALIAAWAG